jgi:transposase InsO family protein
MSSMSRRGDCLDDAVAQRLFSSTLRIELAYRTGWCTRAEARRDVHEYIEVFGHRCRRRSTLGYCTPVEFEQNAALQRDRGSAPVPAHTTSRRKSSKHRRHG